MVLFSLMGVQSLMCFSRQVQEPVLLLRKCRKSTKHHLCASVNSDAMSMLSLFLFFWLC